MRRLAVVLLVVGLVGTVVGVALTALGGHSTRGTDTPSSAQSQAGCDQARTTAAAIAPVFTAQGRGTIGRDEMLTPLRRAQAGFEAAASQAAGARAKDFRDVAGDYGHLRTVLIHASSFSDPDVVTAMTNVGDDTAVLQADCS